MMEKVLEDIAASRARTDASLGAERACTDSTGHLKAAKAAQVLDDLVEKDRIGADEKLSKFRRGADSTLARERSASSAQNSTIANERQTADEGKWAERAATDAFLRRERREADAVLEAERREHEAERLQQEARRQDTDEHLSTERDGADDAVSALGETKSALAKAESVRLTDQNRAELTLKRTEQQLRHAQKMEAVGRLAGSVAHDFNNALSVILALGDFVLTQLEPGCPMHADVEEIRLAAIRAAGITRQLLMFSRQEAVEPKVIDLNIVLANLERLLRLMIGVDVELVFLTKTSVATVRADTGSIEQLVMNLVVNARDAMPTGGRLTIETANVLMDAAFASSHAAATAGPLVMLSVSDNGIGMDAATKACVFEPFFTTKEKGKGTGLGLSIAYGIVRQSGGTIGVDSEPGKGTTFRAYLPYVAATVEDQPPARAPAPLGGSETILLVEDEEQVRAVARDILARHGYQVLEARSGCEALRICEAHQGTIHMLLSDVVMPSMSGPELAKRITESRPELKVLCMSGYTDADVLSEMVGTPFGFVQKPITPVTLTRKVREVLDAQPCSPRTERTDKQRLSV